MLKFSPPCSILYVFSLSKCFALSIGDTCNIRFLNAKGECTPPNFCHDFYTERFYYRNIPVCEYGPSNEIVSICCPLNKICYDGLGSQQKCSEFHPDRCHMVPAEGYTVDDIKAKEKEFPHMAAVGFGTKPKIEWLCGGTIIDSRFVITAAHCTTSDRGSPTWVRVGTLNISSPATTTQDRAVAHVYIHPKYKTSSVYHDIALLRVDRDIEFYIFNDYVKPACLQTADRGIRQLEAAGWGTTSYQGERSYHLLKDNLTFVDYVECKKRFRPGRRMRDGITRGQICAGSRLGADTCQGDSGGPLHYKYYNGDTEYFVLVGITSFGKACGFEDAIGIYTKVSEYVTWIEDIVWPTEETVISFD